MRTILYILIIAVGITAGAIIGLSRAGLTWIKTGEI